MFAQAVGLALLRRCPRQLKAFNRWLRTHGTTVLIGVMAVVGGIMVFDGIYGFVVGT